MAKHRPAFSPAARGDLATVLKSHPAPTIAAIIDALEGGIANWRQFRRLHREGVEQDRSDRAWLTRLAKELDVARREFARLADLARDFETQFLRADPSTRTARPSPAERRIAIGLMAVQGELHLRKGRAGRESRHVLNFNLARVLEYHHVPLTKSRSGVTHRIFAIVYAELGLSEAGDVFRAVQQGVDLVRHGRRFRFSPAAKQVLQSRRKRR